MHACKQLRVSRSWERFACQGKSQRVSFQIREGGAGEGGGGEVGGCWLVALLLHASKGRASESVVSAARLAQRGCVSLPMWPSTAEPVVPMLVFLVVFVLESLAALLQNGFIVAVLGREWGRRRTLPAGDMIVAGLAASRFCLHGMALLNNLLTFFGLSFKIYFNTPWDFLNTLTFWLTAWLAVFYCMKIAFFSHPAFLWLKWRVSCSVPRMLLGSLLLSGVSTVAFTAEHAGQLRPARRSHGNDTLADRWQSSSWYFFLARVVLLWSVPFLLFLASTLLLMFSLQRHLGQMRDRSAGLRDASTQAHTMALKSLAFFLVFHTSYFLFLIVVIRNSVASQNRWRWAWEAVTYTGMCLHSSILVQSSPKLRKALKERLRRAPGKELSSSRYQSQ